MRYSDLDLVSATAETVEAGKMDDKEHRRPNSGLDVSCEENALSEIMDNISLIDEDCFTDRNENSVLIEKDEKEKKKKVKKRVMFKGGANLVMIREIPPREPSPDSESSEESYSESESEMSEEESSSSDTSCNTKVNTETKPVKKPQNNRISRIIREAPLVMRDIKAKEPVVKKPTKKRIVKRVKRETLQKEPLQNRTMDKPTLKPKQIHLKMQETDVLNDNKPKVHIKKKKVNYNGTDNNSKGSLDSKSSKLTLAERLRRRPSKSLLEKREKNGAPQSLTVSGSYTEKSEISDISQPPERPLSQADKRLYSWLLANGRIPGPDQRSPCISPMWDTKQSGFSFWEGKQTEFSI